MKWRPPRRIVSPECGKALHSAAAHPGGRPGRGRIQRWPGLKVTGVVEAADDPALAGDDQVRDRAVVGADEGERPRPAGQGERLADDTAMGEHRDPLTGVGGAEAGD